MSSEALHSAETPAEGQGVVTSEELLALLMEIEQPDDIGEEEWRMGVHKVREALEQLHSAVPFPKSTPRMDRICNAIKTKLDEADVDVASWEDAIIVRIRNEISIRLAFNVNLESNAAFLPFLKFLADNSGKITLATALKTNPEFNSLSQIIYRIVQKFGESREQREKGFMEVADFLSGKIREYLGKDVEVQLVSEVREFRMKRRDESGDTSGSAETKSALQPPDKLLKKGSEFIAELSIYYAALLEEIYRLQEHLNDLRGRLREIEKEIEDLEVKAETWRKGERDITDKYEKARLSLAEIETPGDTASFELPKDLRRKMSVELEKLRAEAPEEFKVQHQKMAERQELSALINRIVEEIKGLEQKVKNFERTVGQAVVMVYELGDRSYEVKDFNAFGKRAGRLVYLKPDQNDILRFRTAGANPGRVRLDEVVEFEITSSGYQPFFKLTLRDGGTSEVSFFIRTPEDLAPWRLLSADRDDDIPEIEPRHGHFLTNIVLAGSAHFGDQIVYEMAYTLAAQADTPEAEMLTMTDIAERIHRDLRKDQLENRYGLLVQKLKELGLELERGRSEEDETVFEYRLTFTV